MNKLLERGLKRLGLMDPKGNLVIGRGHKIVDNGSEVIGNVIIGGGIEVRGKSPEDSVRVSGCTLLGSRIKIVIDDGLGDENE
jgi:hypothetical protein